MEELVCVSMVMKVWVGAFNEILGQVRYSSEVGYSHYWSLTCSMAGFLQLVHLPKQLSLRITARQPLRSRR